MTVPTAAELALLNTHPQRTQLYLSIYEPTVALSCQVNGAYSAANQSLSYDNVTAGNYLNINDYYFQVALIGTTPGAEDVGRTWVRSATNTTLRFVESDHIDWADDLYITVLRYTEIIPVFPRIIQDPGDETDVIFYKIWDVAYTNQNSILGAFINMGSDYAGFLDNGQCSVYWSASGTTHLLGSNLTYNWSFEGASTTGSTAHTPGNIVYTTPGHYRTILTATGANGSVDTSIRYVSVYDRPDAGPDMPIMNFEFSEFSGSRESVGYTCRMRIREPVSDTKVRDGALVVVFKEDWYGYTKQSISKNDKGREGILFVGYINGGTIQYNSDDGYVEFEVVSPTNLMEITECFSVSVESKATPATWYELINMTCKRAIHHYYRWHSTVLLCKDFTCQFTDQNIQYFDADRTSLYDACNTLMDGTLKGRMVSDSLGHVWAEQDVSAIDGSDAAFSTTLDVDKDVFIETPIIDERHYDDVSFIEMGGISYDTGTGASSAYLASAPGSAPGYRGKVERKQGLALSSQSQLNTLVGNLYAFANSKYPGIDLKLKGNYSNLDIAPQEQIKLTIESTDTPRRIAFADKSFALRSIAWNWDATNQVLIPNITVTEMTQGFSGATIVIPEIPPDAGDDGGSFKQPPVIIPPIPTPTTITGGTGTLKVYSLYLVTSDSSGLETATGTLSGLAIKWADGADVAAGVHSVSPVNVDAMYVEATSETIINFPVQGIYHCTFTFWAITPPADGMDVETRINHYNTDGSFISSGMASYNLWIKQNPAADSDEMEEFTFSAHGVFNTNGGTYIKCIISYPGGTPPNDYWCSIEVMGFPY